MLLTLHLELRTQCIQSLSVLLSPPAPPSAQNPYILSSPPNTPDPGVLRINAELIAYDDTATRLLRNRELRFLRQGLPNFVDDVILAHAGHIGLINAHGAKRWAINVSCLAQALKGIDIPATPDDRDVLADGILGRSTRFFDLLASGPERIVKEASRPGAQSFSYDQLRVLMELWFSEQLASPERGISGIARRRMDELLLKVNEILWQA